jgi:hypothetical protein
MSRARVSAGTLGADEADGLGDVGYRARPPSTGLGDVGYRARPPSTGLGDVGYRARPPSTGTTAPVTPLLASPASQTSAAATSSGSSSLRTGCWAANEPGPGRP